VRRQVFEGEIEVVVVVDREGDIDVDEIARRADHVVFSHGSGAAAARNLGAAAAAAELIGFLDDDDEWDRDKTSRQVDELTRRQVDIVSCRVRMQKAGAIRVGGVPRTLLARDEPVDSYLFRRRRPGSRRASLYTSTIVARKQVTSATPWRHGLKRHQDWDWLMRCQRAGAVVVQVPDELVTIAMGSSGSISAAPDWESSMAWAAETIVEPHVLADFLAAQPLRYALQARSAGGVRAVVGEISRLRVVPSAGPIAIGLAGAAPRAHLERMMKWVR
jgi:glycosyltransferase involved in cell wall biosynthesis